MPNSIRIRRLASSIGTLAALLVLLPSIALSVRYDPSVWRIVPNADALGMGGAFSAVAEGPAAVRWNPASLPFQSGAALDIVPYVRPTPSFDYVWFTSSAGSIDFGSVGIGANVNYYEVDDIDRVDANHQRHGVFDWSNIGVLFGAGVDLLDFLGSGREYQPVRIGLGGTFKYYLADDYFSDFPGDYVASAHGWDLDFGSLVRIDRMAGETFTQVSGAWTVENVLDRKVQPDDLPVTRVDRLGLATSVSTGTARFFPYVLRVRLVGDVSGILVTPDDWDTTVYNAGAELDGFGIAALRIGWASDSHGDFHGTSFGARLGNEFPVGPAGGLFDRLAVRVDFASVPSDIGQRAEYFTLAIRTGFH
ncbi:MAG: hypothetical protein KDA27_22245 [Candidatus Eisenbacteria bacterium]|uniref:PorV/PorQ family protein n=1 Tax=Eiseniibacteriota bacterium TaxID=2212470 RepID=A0A956NK32_UNCEI|nr:hypothetical protein [Candidatus Eisenbacteria bacterium]